MPADPFYKSMDWKRIRLAVLVRDGWRCTSCGMEVRGKGQSRVDHRIPRKARPDLAMDKANLRTLCAACDNARHSEKGGVDKPEINSSGVPADGSWTD